MRLIFKIVQYIRRFYPDAIIVAGLGENQDTPGKRIQSWKKGCMKGQPDIMILNCNKSWKDSDCNSRVQQTITKYQSHNWK